MDFLGPICADSQPGFLHLFDLTIAPSFLYYSYIPIILISALTGFYIFFKDKRSAKSRLLLAVTLFFVFWVINVLVQWVGVYDSVVMFAWQMTAVFEVGMFLSTAYLAWVFLYDIDVPFPGKLAFTTIALLTFAAIPTSLNVAAFDLVNCEGVSGPLWYVIYALEPGVVVLVIWWGILAYREQKSADARRQIILFTGGTAFFLAAFFLSNYYGELTKVYEFNLWGPTGMAAFLILLGYLIVKYRAFNVKLFATQVLVLGIAFLIGARLFYSTTTAGLILSTATLIAFLISGVFLEKSVKREIEQREKIEKLAKELEETNGRQETLIHFIGHEVKGFLTKDAGAFAAVAEGDLGALPDTAKQFVERALAETRQGVDSVSNILKASNLKKGTVAYAKEPFDLKALVAGEVEKEQGIAKQKNLALQLSVAEGDYNMVGDKGQIADHVLRNLIDNAINYTPSGTIQVSLKKENGKLIFAVKDSGIGITPEDKARLFTEGGHGKDSIKVNAHSTGYGLYIAKQIVVAHGGSIRAESEGPGKGSTFIAEFPV